MKKFKKWQDRKNMVERTQQLKYTSTLIAEEQKLSVSVHTWKHYRTKKSHAVLVYSKMECPRLLTEKSLLMGSSLPCASIPFWCNNFIHKDWVSWLVFLEDKRFDLLMERQTAVIILVYFPPNSRITPQVSDFWWTLRKYVFWILDHIYSLLLFFPIYFL